MSYLLTHTVWESNVSAVCLYLESFGLGAVTLGSDGCYCADWLHYGSCRSSHDLQSHQNLPSRLNYCLLFSANRVSTVISPCTCKQIRIKIMIKDTNNTHTTYIWHKKNQTETFYYYAVWVVFYSQTANSFIICLKTHHFGSTLAFFDSHAIKC